GRARGGGGGGGGAATVSWCGAARGGGKGGGGGGRCLEGGGGPPPQVETRRIQRVVSSHAHTAFASHAGARGGARTFIAAFVARNGKDDGPRSQHEPDHAALIA